jgi:iron(III) transport system permease protein
MEWRNPWTVIASSIAMVLMAPLLWVFFGLFNDTRAVWVHLVNTVLWEYLRNSFFLMVGVGLGVIVVGVSTAWVVTICRFPGRRVFQWALLLPLAAPSYILAYTYTELLEYYGPIQSSLRGWFGWRNAQEYWFPNVRSLPGGIVMFVLVLYPYVYLLARSAFLNQSNAILEASQSLGSGPWQSFSRIALPMARPAVMAGVALVLMETLNDFGTVEYFSIATFTTGIFRTWFAQGEQVAAMQLAFLMLFFIVGLVVLEKISRQHQRYYQSQSQLQSQIAYRLRGWRSAGAVLLCMLPVMLGFVVPAMTLVNLLFQTASVTAPTTSGDSDGDYGQVPAAAAYLVNAGGGDRFWQFLGNSFLLATVATVLAVALAVVLSYAKRLKPIPVNQIAVQVATSGYAVPGAVVAIGAMAFLGQVDAGMSAVMRSQMGISTGLLLSGSVVALVFVYLVRFLAVSYGAVESSLGNIQPSLDDAAQSLGCNLRQTLWKVHLPLMPAGLISAAILFFVDVMKELPATLIMRPLNFDTLAVRVYNLASDERLAEAAGPALAIVLAGLLPVILLSWQMNRRGHG